MIIESLSICNALNYHEKDEDQPKPNSLDYSMATVEEYDDIVRQNASKDDINRDEKLMESL